MDSGVEQAPGAASWAYKGAALAATSASIYEANFRITQIYTIGFSRGPAGPRVSSLDNGAGRELLLSSGPVSCGRFGSTLSAYRLERGNPASRRPPRDPLRSRHPSRIRQAGSSLTEDPR